MNPYYTHQKRLTEELNRLDYTNPVFVLEFGTGDGSASVLQSFAQQYSNLRIESYDSDLVWATSMSEKYPADNYYFHHVDSWHKIKRKFNGIYDLVFVDAGPLFESRIMIIDIIKANAKVIVLHDYDFYNKGIMEDHYSVEAGSFFGDNYSDDFILEKDTEYPGTLIMRNKLW